MERATKIGGAILILIGIVFSCFIHMPFRLLAIIATVLIFLLWWVVVIGINFRKFK